MQFIGRHLGLTYLRRDLEYYGCNAAQVFTKAPQQWYGKPLISAHKLKYNPEKYYICAHSGYLINMANVASQSREALLHEANRCSHLGIPDLVVHPGSGKASDVVALLNTLEEVWPKDVRLLLENTAGQGKYLGGEIKELQMIIDLVNWPMPLGICFDTAHAWGFGLEIFEEIIHPMVKVVHLNDSLVPKGSRKDRHANLDYGTMPPLIFEWIAANVQVPCIMETPEAYAKQDLVKFKNYLL